MEHYEGVRGRKRVEAISAAIEASGGTIVQEASPSVAPFEFKVRLPDGKLVDLVCYAFTANKYKSGEDQERPDGEHRFQVKFGNDFTRLHDIFIDSKRRSTTLFFGVHEDEDVFIAVDPAMHNPTWFSRMVGFKEKDLRTALGGSRMGSPSVRDVAQQSSEVGRDRA